MKLFQINQAGQRFAILALSVALLSPVMIDVASAQVGPMPPSAPQKPSDPLSDKFVDSLKKFLGQPKATTDEKKAAPQTALPKPDPTNPATMGDDPDRTLSTKKEPKISEQEAPPEETKRPPLLNQPPLSTVKIDDPQVDPDRPPKKLLRLDDPANPLGFAEAAKQIQVIENLIKAKKVAEAKTQLMPLRQWLIDCTEAHIGLFNALNKLPSARGQAELEKQLALEFAQVRDRAMFELGLIYVEEKEYKKAVKELTEVIKSQPKSKVGLMAYEVLQEIGFTEQLQLAQPGN